MNHQEHQEHQGGRLNHREHGEDQEKGRQENTTNHTASTITHQPSIINLISIVLPLHGGREDLKRCLDSVEACRGWVKEVVVVDNASPDEALEEAVWRAWVQVVRNETNRGYAHACNQGAALCSGDVLLFLNSDTIVPPWDCVP